MKKPVKIAIIDTGLTERYISADTKIVESLTFETVCDGGETSELEIYRNLPLYSGTVPSHGTGVINSLIKYSQGISKEFYIFDVFGKSSYSSGFVIVEALERAIEKNPDLIVMSLTCGSEYRDEIMALTKKMDERNIFFICSASNEGDHNFPADLAGIYGVSGGPVGINGLYRYRPNDDIQFYGSDQWEFVGEKGRMHMFRGTSKAAAVVAGRLVRFISDKGKSELNAYLMSEHDELIEKKTVSVKTEHPDLDLLEIFCRKSGLDAALCDEMMDAEIHWNQKNTDLFLGFFVMSGMSEKEILNLNYDEFSTLRNVFSTCEKRIQNV